MRNYSIQAHRYATRELPLPDPESLGLVEHAVSIGTPGGYWITSYTIRLEDGELLTFTITP